MAYSEYLADRVRKRISKIGQIEEKKMMGGLIFMVRGKMCVGVDIDKTTRLDRLMVRVGKIRYEELLKQDGSRPMDFTGKAMRGFLLLIYVVNRRLVYFFLLCLRTQFLFRV